MKTLFLAAVFLIFGGPNFSHASEDGIVRYAKGTVTIQRGYYEKVGDTYVQKNEMVCEKEISIPITDHRQGTLYRPAFVNCDTTLSSKEVSAGVSVGMYFMEFTPEQSTVLLKSVSSSLSVNNKNSNQQNTQPNEAQDTLLSTFATEKLDLDSMWLYLFAPPKIELCNPNGQPACSAPKETISAFVRIEDK